MEQFDLVLQHLGASLKRPGIPEVSLRDTQNSVPAHTTTLGQLPLSARAAESTQHFELVLHLGGPA